MAENIFTQVGGRVQFTPDKVQSDIGPVEYSDEDQIRQLALQRDLTAANLLENDILLDMLDAAIDDQMKEFKLTVPELYEAASNLCGSPTVTWECYKKAKELLKIAPWIAYGYDPVQLTFTDTFQKRSGNVIFDCKQFDPDTFQKDGFDPMDEANKILGLDNNPNTETPSEIESKARENQKKWALLMLFWDLLWGKPVVKPGIPDDESRQQNIDQVNQDIQKLKSEGNTVEADKLSRRLALSENLPNTIMLDRPKSWQQLQWEGKNGPIENLLLNKQDDDYRDVTKDASLPWDDNALAIWVDYGSLFTVDHYKAKSIPALKSGFILAILIGFVSLVPKVTFFFIKYRLKFLGDIRWMYIKKYPVVGRIFRPIYYFLKFLMDVSTSIVAVFSTIFIEICIWLAMLPKHHTPNVSDLPDSKIPDTIIPVNTSMEVLDTPAGFISMDCFTAAQAIVNRVNQETSSDE